MKTIIVTLLSLCFILISYTNLYSQNHYIPKSKQNDSGLYTSPMIEVQPKFPGDINKYFADSNRYPVEARKKNIQGKVYVSFIIEKDGSVSNVTVLRTDNDTLSNEAKRVIAAMPKWRPGMQNGVPQRIKYFIPVVFKL